jgi:mannose-6-phosphate isomerase-like protein (cupin superfamily)
MNIVDGNKNEVPGLRTVIKFINEDFGAERIGVQVVEYMPGVKSGGVHYHEKRESAYIIIEGTAKMSLNGVEHELKPNMAVLLSPGDIHGIVGTGAETFKMIEVYSPLEPDRIDIP